MFHPTDFAGRTRDPKWEAELARWLRTLSENERMTFILEMLDVQFIVALQLAHKCLTERESFVRLLELGVKTANAFSIKFWLNCTVPRLGFRRSVRLLRRFLAPYPEGVGKALYYLQRFPEARTTTSELSELREEVQALGFPVENP
jgi:hypothetical protein